MDSSELELITTIIMEGRYGNCRENAFVGAYIASRLNKFKQVSVIGVIKTNYYQEEVDSHAVSLACEGGSETYDVTKWRYIKIDNSNQNTSTEILNANCTIIDPWGNETMTMAQFLKQYNGYEVISLMPIKLEDDANRLLYKSTSNHQVYSQLTHSTSAAETSRTCSFGSPPDFCSSPAQITACTISAKNIKVNAVIHYSSEDQHYVGYDSRHFFSETDEPSSYSDFTFYQSYSSEDGNELNEMNVKFNQDLTKVIEFSASYDTTVIGENIPGGSYNIRQEIEGTTIDVDPSNHRLFRMTGANACDKISKITYTQTGEGVSNWEVLGVAEEGCDKDAELTIQISTD
jgi:hypothetical protein